MIIISSYDLYDEKMAKEFNYYFWNVANLGKNISVR